MSRKYHILNPNGLGVTPFGMEVFLCRDARRGESGRGVVGEVQRGKDSENGSEIQRETDESCMCVCTCACVCACACARVCITEFLYACGHGNERVRECVSVSVCV